MVKGKGRPNNNKVAPEAGKRPKPRQYHPLHPEDVFQDNEIDININKRHDVLRIKHAAANYLDVLPQAKVPRNE